MALPFIDQLTMYLFLVSFTAATIAYMILNLYLKYRRLGFEKMSATIKQELKATSIPLWMLSIGITVMGFYGQMTWNLPQPYNILFYDPFFIFGLVVLAFVASVWLGVELKYAGLLSFLAGLMLIFYGATGYSLGLTRIPLLLLLLYSSLGIAAILAFPVLTLLDSASEGKIKNPSGAWSAIIALFFIFTIIGAIVAAFIGANSLAPHLIA